jgi:uncharacterized protein (DUF1499 family)
VKKAFRNMTMLTVFAIIALLGMLAYIRLAPITLSDWHVALPTDTRLLEGKCANGISTITGGARVSCTIEGTAAEALSRLNDIALASPRTRLIAGSPDEGRITWETRSLIIGFPDYTTAQAETQDAKTRLDIYARLRFGQSDFGVNAARLAAWLKDF